MSLLLSPLASCIAAAIALSFGRGLGVLALRADGFRVLTSLLTGARSGLLPCFLLLLLHLGPVPSWLKIGIAVGCLEAVAAARFIARPHNDWTADVVSAVALGATQASILSRNSGKRGALYACTISCFVLVPLFEAVLTRMVPDAAGLGLGPALWREGQEGGLSLGTSLGLVLHLLTAAWVSWSFEALMGGSWRHHFRAPAAEGNGP